MTPLACWLLGASALALAACSADGRPPPKIAYDSKDFALAVVEPRPNRPVISSPFPSRCPCPAS